MKNWHVSRGIGAAASVSLAAVTVAFAGPGCVESSVHEHEAPSHIAEASSRSASAAPRWSYEGAEGTSHWGSLAPEFSACGSGKQQSPVGLVHGDVTVDAKLSPLQFDYPAAPVRLVHDGHTVNVFSPAVSELTTPSGRYELVQFHFHVPSEHTLDGKHFDAEMHLVHKNAHGDRVVVGIFLSAGAQENPALRAVFENAPKDPEKEASSGVPVDLAHVVSGSAAGGDSYFTYAGSLTVPPCSEGITWYVLNTPRSIGQSQLEHLHAALHGDTNRPLQLLDGRTVRRSAL